MPLYELREILPADEWDFWLDYHAAYDLPDGFLVTGMLGALISNAVGGKGKLSDFAPYYQHPNPQSSGANPSIARAIQFLRANGHTKSDPS